MKHGAILAVLIVSSAAALAQVTTIETDNPLPRISSNPDRIVCERIQRTGSRLEFETVCLSARQWKDHKDGHRADLEKVQQIVNQNPSH
jgi:hypothetical protein